MKKKELEHYRKKLLKEKERLVLDLRELDKSSLHATTKEDSGNLSGYVSHLADVATDNYEQEKNISFMTNEEYLLQEVEDALLKIEKKAYGKCEACGTDIKHGRLSAEAYARLCMTCKKKEEENKDVAQRGNKRNGRRR